MALTTILLVVHVLGAIAGIGPTFAFGYLGKQASKGGEGGLAIMEAMYGIETKITTPVVLVTQPLTGVWLIFRRGYNHAFFKNEWLVISIVLYLAIMIISYGPNIKIERKMIEAMKSGGAGSTEFVAGTKKLAAMGGVMGLAAVVIVVMMVWKPGQQF